MSEKINVKFLFNEREHDLYAVFFVDEKKRTWYPCFGQGHHSVVHKSYISESRLAEENEYIELRKELKNKGYNVEILNKQL